jgi:hypothetical protein
MTPKSFKTYCKQEKRGKMSESKKKTVCPWKNNEPLKTDVERIEYTQDCANYISKQWQTDASEKNPILYCNFYTTSPSINSKIINSTRHKTSPTKASETLIESKQAISKQKSPNNNNNNNNTGQEATSPNDSIQKSHDTEQEYQKYKTISSIYHFDQVNLISDDTRLPCNIFSYCKNYVLGKDAKEQLIEWSHWPQRYTVLCKECHQVFKKSIETENQLHVEPLTGYEQVFKKTI